MGRDAVVERALGHLQAGAGLVAPVVDGDVQPAPVQADVMVVQQAVDQQDAEQEEDPAQGVDIAAAPGPFQPCLVELELDVAGVVELLVEDVRVGRVFTISL